MTHTAPSRLSAVVRAAVAFAVIGAVAFSATPASAASFSFVLSSGVPDFGFAKAGTVQTRQFDLLNDGENSITVDPAPLTSLAAPFSASMVSFTKTTVIPKNGHATFSVTYTVPVAGTVSTVPISLLGTDQTDNMTMPLAITFRGTSTITDPAHFVAKTSKGTDSIDFGSVPVGGSAAETLTLTVDGVLPIFFENSGLSVVDTAGQPLPSVTVTGTSFGNTGVTTPPRGSQTVQLAYRPTAGGPQAGSVRIVGTPVTGAAETSAISITVPLTASAVPVPTNPPATTAPPTTPATSVATITPGGSQAGGSYSSTGGHGGSAGSLAETGLPVAGLVGLAALLAVGGLTALVTIRRRLAARR